MDTCRWEKIVERHVGFRRVVLRANERRRAKGT